MENDCYNLIHISLLKKNLQNYMEKEGILLIFGVFVFLIISSSVSANFVCGEVNSPEDLEAGWFDVTIYYSEETQKTSSCKVSPENKYCCDPNEIEGVAWDIGKEVNAKILKDNYVATPVSLIISGEGYDIFPTLELVKALTIHEPNLSMYVNVSNILVNVSSSGGYNNLSYRLYNNGNLVSEEEICLDCNQAEFYISPEAGNILLEIIATNEFNDKVIEEKEFIVLDYINFNRVIECKRCRDNFVYYDEEVNMTVSVEFSSPVTGIFEDYFPKDWKYLGEQEIEEVSSTHNRIWWHINGTKVEKSYMLRSPKVFFAKRYLFRSGFESIEGPLDKVIVYRFYKFLAFPKKYERAKLEPIENSTYNEITRDTPLVMNFNHKILSQVAIFPKGVEKDVSALIYKKSFQKMRRAHYNFMIDSGLMLDEFDKVLVRFKIKKPNSKRKYIKNATLFHYDLQSELWKPLDTTQYNEDENYVYYESYAQGDGAFAIKREYGRR